MYQYMASIYALYVLGELLDGFGTVISNIFGSISSIVLCGKISKLKLIK